MRGSKFPADMHNYIWCPIYIPSFMIIGSVVSEESRGQDFGTDGWTDGRSDCTPRPAFAFGDTGKNDLYMTQHRLKPRYVNRVTSIRYVSLFSTGLVGSLCPWYICHVWIKLSKFLDKCMIFFFQMTYLFIYFINLSLWIAWDLRLL